MAARGLKGTGGYAFLPKLEEVGKEPEFSKLFPTLAHVLQASVPKSGIESPGLSPQRRRLLERAAEQARPAERQQPKQGDGLLTESEEQLLFLLSSLLAQEREEVRMETEAKLRAAFSAPPGERRTLIEAQRQKWRALEDTVKELTDLIRNPPAREKGTDPEEWRKTREMKASQSLTRLKSLEAASFRAKVIALTEMVELFETPNPLKEAGGAVTSLLKLGMGEDPDERIAKLERRDPLEAAKMRREKEVQRVKLEQQMREQIKEELMRQAQVGQDAEIKELQLQLSRYEREKARMETEIKTLRQADLGQEADKVEERLKEESAKNLSSMRKSLTQRASLLGHENEDLKKQLAQQEDMRKQLEDEEKQLKEAQAELEKQRRFNEQSTFEGKLHEKQEAALKSQAEESERHRREAEDELEHARMQAAVASKMKGAAGVQKQAEIQRRVEEAEKKVKDAEIRGNLANKLAMGAVKGQKDQMAKQEEQWKEDKHKLLSQMRDDQLKIAAMAVLERQRLLGQHSAARLENYRQQWWSEVDVQRVSTAKHLLLRCVRSTKPGIDDDAARSVSKLREALHASGTRLAELQDETGSSTIPKDELKEHLESGMRASDDYKRKMEPFLQELLPGPESEAILHSAGFPSPSSRHAAVMEDEFEKERDKMEEARAKAHGRLLEAEAQLDALAKDEIAADLASSWATSVGAMADQKRIEEIRRKELQARIEGELKRETGADIQRAKNASQSAAAAAAASAAANEAERQRAEEDNKRHVEAALQEAERQRLVPVRLKLNGLKMSQLKDKVAFEQAFAEKIRATLDLDESQLRVLEISAGTG